MSGAVRFPVPDLVRRRAVSEGEAGLAWLTSLDDTLAGLEHDWGVAIGPAYDGGSAAFVADAVTSEDAVFVIKVGTPGTDIGRNEADVLRSAGGKGYVELIRHDATRRVLLLEKLGPRLDTLEMPYRQQIDIMCATLLQAWMPVPQHAHYPNGADKANSLAEAMLRMWYGASQPGAQKVLDTALMYCKDRAAAWRPETAVLSHGDPHPANILAAPAATTGFKFIDPDGLAIEPAYDLGVLLRAWHEGIEGRHAHDIARSHAHHLTTRTQVPAEAIWQWGYIERVSTGLHLMALGETAKGREFLAVAEALTP